MQPRPCRLRRVVHEREHRTRRVQQVTETTERVGDDPVHRLPGRTPATACHTVEETLELAASFRQHQPRVDRTQHEHNLALTIEALRRVRGDLHTDPVPITMRDSDLQRNVQTVLTDRLMQGTRGVAEIIGMHPLEDVRPHRGYRVMAQQRRR